MSRAHRRRKTEKCCRRAREIGCLANQTGDAGFLRGYKTPPANPSPSVRSSPSHKHPTPVPSAFRDPQAKMKSAIFFSAAALVASVAGLTVNTP